MAKAPAKKPVAKKPAAKKPAAKKKTPAPVVTPGRARQRPQSPDRVEQ